MELKITGTEVEQKPIQFNYEELKTQIKDKAKVYENMVYDEDHVKEAKADRAALNKFKAALEGKRREVKKECLKPYEEFEKQINDLISIVAQPIFMIDTQIKDYEASVKAEKARKINELYDEILADTLYVTIDDIMEQHSEWLNKTTSMKKIKDGMEEIKEKVERDLETIRALPNFAFEAENDYRTHLDLGHAIQEGKRLADIQKRKEEAEAERAKKLEEEAERKALEEEARRAEEELKKLEPVEDLIEPFEPDEFICGNGPEEEPEAEEDFEERQWVTFKAHVTIKQAEALGNYCRANGIELEIL